MNAFSRTMTIIDDELANLTAIELRGNVPSTSTSAAKLALIDLKRRMQEDAVIGQELLAAV